MSKNIYVLTIIGTENEYGQVLGVFKRHEDAAAARNSKMEEVVTCFTADTPKVSSFEKEDNIYIVGKGGLWAILKIIEDGLQ